MLLLWIAPVVSNPSHVTFPPVHGCCGCVDISTGDRTVRLWSVTTHTCVKVFEGHSSSVLRVRFVRAGMQLLSAGADGLVKLWSVKDNLVRGCVLRATCVLPSPCVILHCLGCHC